MYTAKLEKCGEQEQKLFDIFIELLVKYETGNSVFTDDGEESDRIINTAYDIYESYGGQ